MDESIRVKTNVSKEDIEEFFKEYLQERNTKHRKLMIPIFTEKSHEVVKEAIKDEIKRIYIK